VTEDQYYQLAVESERLFGQERIGQVTSTTTVRVPTVGGQPRVTPTTISFDSPELSPQAGTTPHSPSKSSK